MISIRARERGMSYWPFVVTLVLFLVMFYMYYEASSKATDLESRLNAAVAARTQAEERESAISQAADRIRNKTGFVEGDVVSVEKMNQWMADGIKRAAEAATMEVQADRFVEGSAGEIEQIQGEKIVVKYLVPGDVNRLAQPGARLDQLFEPMISAFERMKADINQIRTAMTKAQDELAAAKAAHVEQLANKDTAISEEAARSAAVQASLDELKREKDDQIETLKTQLDQATAEAESAREEFESQLTAMNSQLNQAKSVVSQLNTREKPFVVEGPDGAVLHAANENLVIIDLGKKDMLMPGTVFTVIGKIKGGSRVQKGTIKVTNVGDTTAEARVLDGGGINQGDLVQSAVYSKDRVLHFHLLGNFSKMGRSDAEMRLQALGAKIDDSVLPTTHYVVAGTPSEGEAFEGTDAWRRAKEYNIPIITEAQLEAFTRY